MSRERCLRWDACLNVRDLGGYPTAGGGRTRWRALVRADTLSRLTPAGRNAVTAYGVTTVIDLRFPDEAARVPHPFRVEAGAPPAPAASGALGAPRYLNVPISSGRDPALDARVFAALGAARTRAEAYAVDVDYNSAGFARIAAAVARAPAGGVVLHCQAGRDRTGVAVALLLALLGVPDDLIAEDYALSALYLLEHYERLEDGASRRELIEDMEGVTRDTMGSLLGHIRDRHGGAEAYLLAGGATPHDLAALRRRLIEP